VALESGSKNIPIEQRMFGGPERKRESDARAHQTTPKAPYPIGRSGLVSTMEPPDETELTELTGLTGVTGDWGTTAPV
jgi:hypothetical protein